MKKKNDMDRPSIEELQFLQALNSSCRLLLNYGARRIKEMEITMAQAYMLVFLGLHPDMTLEDISKELLLAKSAIHLTLHQLVKGGYLEKVPVPHEDRCENRREREADEKRRQRRNDHDTREWRNEQADDG